MEPDEYYRSQAGQRTNENRIGVILAALRADSSALLDRNYHGHERVHDRPTQTLGQLLQ